MSRYINADKLKREDLCDICGSADCSNCFSDDDFEEWIDKQPTAYDVEAVCKQIKKVGAIDRKGMIHMQAALEIVQKGGNTNEHRKHV